MGTRADFYVGRGADAEWLGSIAWDGYPSGLEREGLLNATTDEQYRAAVAAELDARDDATTPEMGWPWPWDDSNTTDYAYAFDGGKVHGSCFGGNWFDAAEARDSDGEEREEDGGEPAVFPNMKDRKNVTFGARSGTIIVGG